MSYRHDHRGEPPTTWAGVLDAEREKLMTAWADLRRDIERELYATFEPRRAPSQIVGIRPSDATLAALKPPPTVEYQVLTDVRKAWMRDRDERTRVPRIDLDELRGYDVGTETLRRVPAMPHDVAHGAARRWRTARARCRATSGRFVGRGRPNVEPHAVWADVIEAYSAMAPGPIRRDRDEAQQQAYEQYRQGRWTPDEARTSPYEAPALDPSQDDTFDYDD